MPSDRASTPFTGFDSSALASLSGNEWYVAITQSLRRLRSSVHTMSSWKNPSALKTRRELEEVKTTIQSVTDGLRYFYEEPFEQSRTFFSLSVATKDRLAEGDIPTGHQTLLPKFVEMLRTAITAHPDPGNNTASDVTSKYSRSLHDDLTQMHKRASYAAYAGLCDEATLNRMADDSELPETSLSTITQNLVRLTIG